jgi:hypothetical protein
VLPQLGFLFIFLCCRKCCKCFNATRYVLYRHGTLHRQAPAAHGRLERHSFFQLSTGRRRCAPDVYYGEAIAGARPGTSPCETRNRQRPGRPAPLAAAPNTSPRDHDHAVHRCTRRGSSGRRVSTRAHARHDDATPCHVRDPTRSRSRASQGHFGRGVAETAVTMTVMVQQLLW